MRLPTFCSRVLVASLVTAGIFLIDIGSSNAHARATQSEPEGFDRRSDDRKGLRDQQSGRCTARRIGDSLRPAWRFPMEID
jgi:hypothetical protein